MSLEMNHVCSKIRLHGKIREVPMLVIERFLLAPLAVGQRAYVMVHCPSSVCPSVRKLFLQKTSPQKLLTGFL